MLGAGGEEELLELPIGKAALEMTEEMMLKKTEKNRKRRLQAQKRKEKRKVQTHFAYDQASWPELGQIATLRPNCLL